MAKIIRVWDLPTRFFHWGLAVCVICLIITGYLGGNAMPWHFRFGFCVLTLLLFRFVWGLVGGHWSRFASFIYAPSTILNYLRGRGRPQDSVGHNPIGAFSVFAMLGLLALQVSTGLFSDDEIASAGPLSRFLKSGLVSQITGYHKGVGKWIVIGLGVLHIGAILFYRYKKRENLIRPMLLGDKEVGADLPSSRDSTQSRLLALVILMVCAAAVYGLVGLGGS
jgi:cytochrome b